MKQLPQQSDPSSYLCFVKSCPWAQRASAQGWEGRAAAQGTALAKWGLPAAIQLVLVWPGISFWFGGTNESKSPVLPSSLFCTCFRPGVPPLALPSLFNGLVFLLDESTPATSQRGKSWSWGKNNFAVHPGTRVLQLLSSQGLLLAWLEHVALQIQWNCS